MSRVDDTRRAFADALAATGLPVDKQLELAGLAAEWLTAHVDASFDFAIATIAAHVDASFDFAIATVREQLASKAAS